MKNFIALLIIVSFILSCKPKQETVKTDSKTESENTATAKTTEMELTVDEPRDSTSILPISVSPMNNMKEIGDPYSILSAKIIDDILWMTVSYGGGCREHEFTMLFNNAYTERFDEETGKSSYISLTLKHQGNGDNCRSIVNQNIRFDLKSLKNPGYENLIIRLKNWEEELNYAN